MATPKLNPSRSIAVIPSDLCNIPNPALFITSATIVIQDEIQEGYITVQGWDLVDKFNVKIGDIIYSYYDGIGVTITKIEKLSSLLLGDITVIYFNSPLTILTPGTSFDIYNGEDDSTGCVLYVGTGGTIQVVTEGGDEVMFQNVPTGSFFPVQVLKVESSHTDALNILALR